jgi:hypothetical protein
VPQNRRGALALALATGLVIALLVTGPGPLPPAVAGTSKPPPVARVRNADGAEVAVQLQPVGAVAKRQRGAEMG